MHANGIGLDVPLFDASVNRHPRSVRLSPLDQRSIDLVVVRPQYLKQREGPWLKGSNNRRKPLSPVESKRTWNLERLS